MNCSATLQGEFAEIGTPFEVHGRVRVLYAGKPMALKRCLTNLISNATKFGGGVSVHVEDGAAVVIAVRDQGPGIPAEHLARVFEPFYRVESSRNRDTGGTGLGLCIARDIAQAHGGALTLQNLPQGGLQATLTLPRSLSCMRRARTGDSCVPGWPAVWWVRVTSWIYELIVWVQAAAPDQRLRHRRKHRRAELRHRDPQARRRGLRTRRVHPFLDRGDLGHPVRAHLAGLRARSIEATLAALFYGVLAWVVMHNVVLALFSPAPPTYTVYSVINGLMAHTFAFSVPMALVIKRLLR